MQKAILIYFMLSLILFGCTAQPLGITTPTSELEKKLVTDSLQGTIIPTTTLPSPKRDTGIVTGILFSRTINTAPPIISLFLGEYMYLTPGPDYMITHRQKSSPNTTTETTGRFIFNNVPPGDYPLIAWTPFYSHIISDKDGKKELVVHVEAGKIIDLGLIEVDWP